MLVLAHLVPPYKRQFCVNETSMSISAHLIFLDESKIYFLRMLNVKKMYAALNWIITAKAVIKWHSVIFVKDFLNKIKNPIQALYRWKLLHSSHYEN